MGSSGGVMVIKLDSQVSSGLIESPFMRPSATCKQKALKITLYIHRHPVFLYHD